MAKKSPKKYPADEVKRYLGALSEQHRHDIQAIGEQYFDIKKTMYSHGKTLLSHTEMIGQLMADVTDIKNNLRLKVDLADFSKLEKRVARLEARSR